LDVAHEHPGVEVCAPGDYSKQDICDSLGQNRMFRWHIARIPAAEVCEESLKGWMSDSTGRRGLKNELADAIQSGLTPSQLRQRSAQLEPKVLFPGLEEENGPRAHACSDGQARPRSEGSLRPRASTVGSVAALVGKLSGTDGGAKSQLSDTAGVDAQVPDATAEGSLEELVATVVVAKDDLQHPTLRRPSTPDSGRSPAAAAAAGNCPPAEGQDGVPQASNQRFDPPTRNETRASGTGASSAPTPSMSHPAMERAAVPLGKRRPSNPVVISSVPGASADGAAPSHPEPTVASATQHLAMQRAALPRGQRRPSTRVLPSESAELQRSTSSDPDGASGLLARPDSAEHEGPLDGAGAAAPTHQQMSRAAVPGGRRRPSKPVLFGDPEPSDVLRPPVDEANSQDCAHKDGGQTQEVTLSAALGRPVLPLGRRRPSSLVSGGNAGFEDTGGSAGAAGCADVAAAAGAADQLQHVTLARPAVPRTSRRPSQVPGGWVASAPARQATPEAAPPKQEPAAVLGGAHEAAPGHGVLQRPAVPSGRRRPSKPLGAEAAALVQDAVVPAH